MVDDNEYFLRRKKLAEQLPKHSIALICAAQEAQRNGDSHYRFRQDSDFYYLTGCNEPDAILIISSGKESKSTLFNRSRNPIEEQWTGKRLGQEGAIMQLKMDAAYPLTELKEQLPKLLLGNESVYYLFGKNPPFEQQLMQALSSVKAQIRRGAKAPDNMRDLEPLLGEMRLFKTDAEIALLRCAAKISVEAHKRAMRAGKKAHHEYELEAELIYEFTRQGCRSVAYDPIVGGGENACTLHYTANNKQLNPGELVLIDAGAEYENYAADITRTFPVNGVFTQDQRILYELVLKAQQAGIAKIRPGTPWNSVQLTIVEILTAGLVELGILKGAVDELIAKEAYKPFYMHSSGHWLGLDVHDSGLYKINNEWRPFKAGMVLTVEPGLYMSREIPGLDKRWWDMGIRIEDDVLVTDTGHEVLTGDLPVEVEAIEALMRD